jgi:hypothetical protein
MKKSERGALVNQGANGGILGADAHVWQKHRQKIDVTGIDNHEMTGLQMVDGTAFVKTQNGPPRKRSVLLHFGISLPMNVRTSLLFVLSTLEK